jgi:hypothetical protein
VNETLADTQVEAILRDGDLTLSGRLLSASNATFVGQSSLDGVSVDCVYKPVRGEMPCGTSPTARSPVREVAVAPGVRARRLAFGAR